MDNMYKIVYRIAETQEFIREENIEAQVSQYRYAARQTAILANEKQVNVGFEMYRNGQLASCKVCQPCLI